MKRHARSNHRHPLSFLSSFSHPEHRYHHRAARMYTRLPSCSSRRTSRSITKSHSLPSFLSCVFLYRHSSGRTAVHWHIVSTDLPFSQFSQSLYSHSGSTKLSYTTRRSSNPSCACEAAARVVTPCIGLHINSRCTRIDPESILMCLMTYILHLDLSMSLVLAYAWSFDVFFSIQSNLIITLLHSKMQHV